MAIDHKYIAGLELQELLVDKLTGEPLSEGQIFFWKDQARSEPKTVYRLSGSPPNYSFTALSNPVNLGVGGTVVDDDNNDVVIYYYPYDDIGNVELYFVQVKSLGGEDIFTREAWPPNVGAGDVTSNTFKTFIENGQFWLHNNIPADDIEGYEAGEIREPITDIAEGGWTFERPDGSTAKDFVKFDRFAQDVINPSANPRYALRVNNTIVGDNNAYKDVRIKFRNVNQFASPTDMFTFALNGIDHSSGGAQLKLILIKNFGTGGATSTEEELHTFTLGTAYGEMQSFSFNFGSNTADNLGDSNDDFIQLALRYPTVSIFDISVTDILLGDGDEEFEIYPAITINEAVYGANAGNLPIPDYNGMNLYLPIVQGIQGFEYDYSEVAKVYMALYPQPGRGELLCNGLGYFVSGYSDDKIPYRRLFNKLFNNGNSLNIPLFGCGPEFVDTYITTLVAANELRINANSSGIINSFLAAGTSGFPFSADDIEGLTTNVTAYMLNTSQIFGVGDFVGAVTVPNTGTSGFTVTPVFDVAGGFNAFYITTIVATTLAGKYFTFNSCPTVNGSNDPYYIWFEVDGAGSDPAPGGTGILVKLNSLYTEYDVACLIKEALSGHQTGTITVGAPADISSGSYFLLDTNFENYYIWYTKEGIGNDPEVSGRIGIRVDILDADTAAQATTKTQIQLNSMWFAVPNFQGMFPRGFDTNGDWDPDTAARFSNVSSLFGNKLGTSEYFMIQSHNHLYVDKIYNHSTEKGSGDPFAPLIPPDDTVLATAYTGGSETRPINFNVNFVIKY